MNKLTIPLSLLAAATLAACGTPQVRTANSEPAYAAIALSSMLPRAVK